MGLEFARDEVKKMRNYVAEWATHFDAEETQWDGKNRRQDCELYSSTNEMRHRTKWYDWEA